MNEFQFNHLKNRHRLRLPRPILYVGVAIILFAFFSIKMFQRTGDVVTAPSDSIVAEAPVPVPDQVDAGLHAAAVETAPRPVSEHEDDGSGGILSLDGEGDRLLPPRVISGQRPVIPASLLGGDTLASPSVYVRVGKDGLVTHCKLVSSSGSDEVDRLVLDALEKYVFHPAMTAGQPVEFSSVVTVSLHAADHAFTPSGSGNGFPSGGSN